MSLSYEDDGGKPIAIVSSKSSKLMNNKVLYLNDKHSDKAVRKNGATIEMIDYVLHSKTKQRTKAIKKLYDALNNPDKDFEDDDDKIMTAYHALSKKSHNASIVDLPDDCKFELLPLMPSQRKNGELRDTVFISGMAGSGKTWFAKNFIILYSEMYPKNKIFFISQQDKDNDVSLKEIRNLMIQISIDDIMDELSPITWESFTDNPCLLFFDDYDGFSSKKDSKKKTSEIKAVMQLIDDVLRNGRKFSTSCIISSHDLNKAHKMETVLKECEYICIYPNGIMKYHLEYFCNKYLGLDKQQIQQIKKCGSRWVVLRRKYPIFMLTENRAEILE